MEAALYPHWEQCTGRTLWGPEGRYRLLYPGQRNGGPGPDYLGAQVTFPDGTLHRGDVEIHVRRASWRRHRHRWDSRYSQVILHVVAYGGLRSVPQDQWRRVPTLALPRTPTPQLPCEVTSLSLADDPDQDEFLRSLATQRWWRRLADMGRSESGQQEALARRLGPDRYHLKLPDRWRQQLTGQDDLFTFTASLLADLQLVAGRGRAAGLILGRVALLSAVAYTHGRRPEELASWSLAELRQLADGLRQAGFPAPTDPFLVEVAGNWLLPFSWRAGGGDRFDEWYRLPRGWSYGRVQRHVARLGLGGPTCFGQQQGLLEWLESLCQPVNCEACPVVGGRGGL